MALPLIPIVFLMGGALLVAWGFRQRSLLAAMPTGWTQVTGRVVGASGGAARIEYVAPGGRRLRLQAPAEAHVEDGEVDVLVDPADPTRARLAAQDGEIARLARTFILLGAVSLVIGVLALVAFG